MSRWPSEMTLAYLRHEGEQRMARILALRVSYGCAKERPLPAPIIDHDPGDEHDTKEHHQ